MVRRSLFLGLTGMLVVVIVYLVVQGRKQERAQQQNPRTVEVIRESRPTLTRVIAPTDLQIVESRVQISSAGSGSSPERGLSAKHQIVIRNDGKNTYRNPRLRMTYFGHGEKTLDARTKEVDGVVQPGQTQSLNEITIENLPAGAARSTVKILSADLERPAPVQK